MENTNEQMKTLCQTSAPWEMVASVDLRGSRDGLWQGGACGGIMPLSKQLLALLGSGQLFKGIGFLESQHEKKCV